jgi:pilus assembly protein Flp/PilA
MLEKFIAFQLFMIAKRDEEKGATAVEYGLLVALIAAVIITTVVLLGTQIKGAFTSITSSI